MNERTHFRAIRLATNQPQMPLRLLICLLVLSMVAAVPRRAAAQEVASRDLLEISRDIEHRLKPSCPQVTFAPGSKKAPGIVVTIQPGEEAYPGVHIKPADTVWNLAAFGHVEASVLNTGAKPLTLALRVDDSGDWKDNPSNTESIRLSPGASEIVKVIFGYGYGDKPSYAIHPAKIVNLVLFALKSDSVQSFRIESVVAGGTAGEKPPVSPDDVRIAPPNGWLLGANTPSGSLIQSVTNGARASFVRGSLRPELDVVLPPATPEAAASLRPFIGRWDLRHYLAVRVAVRNTGKAPINLRLRLESNGGNTPWITSAKPLLPGQATILTVPFSGPVMDLDKPETLKGITSDAVSAVAVAADGSPDEGSLRVESIQAFVPPALFPAWLGKRPPVEGDWEQTLDEEFTSSKLDPKRWSIYGANYWDKQSHWSKDNVLLGNGVVKLRYQKKQGFNNDDPKEPQSNYASGYLHTYGLWTQRYGYFEARMKLPTASGLWPAFWMMPDRGAASKNRQDTGNGGMEFDILEHLTRWGPYRYNIAMHWDGYGKDHKSLGSDRVYMQTDKDGYVTAGLLWTPGSVVYYCNGVEVLRWENPRIGSVPEILMFTLPMGGWDNSPLDDARLPDDFVIDYVRVWQRKDLR